MHFIVFAPPSLAVFIISVIIKRTSALANAAEDVANDDVTIMTSRRCRITGRSILHARLFNYTTTNMNYAVGCDLNQSPNMLDYMMKLRQEQNRSAAPQSHCIHYGCPSVPTAYIYGPDFLGFLQRGRIACNAERCNTYSNSVCPSVRLSVRLSVTRWYPIQTNEHRITRSSL